jgi:transposase
MSDLDYQKIRDKISDGKKIVEIYKDLTPKPVLEVCYTMFDINELLVNKLEEIDIRTKKNSKNSSRPPSTDQKGNTSKMSQKKSGGQDGHGGTTLRRSHPDQTIYHRPRGSCVCGNDLSTAAETNQIKSQAIEVEIIKKVIDHIAVEVTCSCGKKHLGNSPYASHLQYGASVQAIVSYFSKYQLIPFERLSELMRDIFQVGLCEGTVDNIGNKGFKKLDRFEVLLREAMLKEKSNHSDETPTRVNGKNGYLHVFSNEAFTYLKYHYSRGMVALEEIGLIAKYRGILVHDCFKMYFNLNCHHAVCNSHLLRELYFVTEVYNHEWSKKVAQFLYDLNDYKKYLIGKKIYKIDQNDLDLLREELSRLLDDGRKEVLPLLRANKGKRRSAQAPPVNLCNRMLKLQKEILMFAEDFDIEFTNNQAERDLRMAKVHLKISGQFKSENGAKMFCSYRSFIGTLKKHKLNIMQGLRDLFLDSSDSLNQIFIPRAE